jgi:hypothetical protein
MLEWLLLVFSLSRFSYVHQHTTGAGAGAWGISASAEAAVYNGGSMHQPVPPQIWQQEWQAWMLLVLTVLANLVVVLFGAAWNNRHIEGLRSEMNARIDAVRAEVLASRAETREYIAEAELRITKEILELKGRVERIEEQRGLIQQR